MIIKIWPIKGTQGVKKSVLYVQDNQKVTKIEHDEEGNIIERKVIDIQENEKDTDNFFINNEENIDRVLSYMANEEKIGKKYISGYMCDPNHAQRDFNQTWLAARGTHPHKAPGNLEKEVLAFHIVQSFPEDIEISDEEVHQCGIELLQKLEKHQGIICSHVHSVVDEEGEVHGACKHNHILINAYIDPLKRDPEHPDRLKYHDCKETYAQLQIWNDEIAIEHGLPIILNPDKERTYSWKENYEAKNGQSWKERVRLDIEDARRISSGWDEFKKEMESYGYQIREGVHVTYSTPDKKYKVRAQKLGRSYTKEGLETYWRLRNRLEQDTKDALKDNAVPSLWEISKKYHGELTADILLGAPRKEQRPFYSLPLSKSDRDRAVLSTYFNSMDLYKIRDNSGQVVVSVTGKEIIDYLDALNQGKEPPVNEQQTETDEYNRWQEETRRRREKEENEAHQEYIQSQFRSSRTHKYYVVNAKDKNGRRRSNLELIFLIAAIVIQKEDGLWNTMPIPEGRENEAIFGPTSWKVQNMLDSIHIAEEESLSSPADVDERLNEVGAAYSRAKAALGRTQKAKEKMVPLSKAITEYEETAESIDRILALPEGPKKDAEKERFAGTFERYKQAKSVMYGYKVKSKEEIDDFKVRFADIEKNLPKMQEELDLTKEQYRKLKKLQYNISLAQNEQYCYGPEYGIKTQEEKENLWQTITEQDSKEVGNRKQ